MGKSAVVVDLEAFRQRKVLREERAGATTSDARGEASPAMMVPVWFCWVPVWAPVVT